MALISMETKKWAVQLGGENDPRAHPHVDLDPLGMPCVTMPILNLNGDVLACIQMVCGHGSPKISMTESRADGFGFEEAAIHLAGVLSAPLQSVLNAMWDIDHENGNNRNDSNSQLSIAMENFKEDLTMKPPVVVPTKLEIEVMEKVLLHLKMRETMGYVEIEKARVDDLKDQLEKIKIEKDDMKRISTAMKRDMVATQLFYAEKKILNPPKIVDESESIEAKEIAGRVKLVKKHSR